MSGTESSLHIRQHDDGTADVVNCPYEWFPLTKGQFRPGAFVRACVEANTVICLGPGCAIYPCERVRDFAEGKI